MVTRPLPLSALAPDAVLRLALVWWWLPSLVVLRLHASYHAASSLARLRVWRQAGTRMRRGGAAAANSVHLRLLLDDIVVVDDDIILQLDVVAVS